jgi:hypothetical protein
MVMKMMSPEKLDMLRQAWQAKYGYRSCEAVFDRWLLLYTDLAITQVEYSSETEHRMVGGMLRFFVRVEIKGDGVTIELQLGKEPLASYELSDVRGAVDSETIYSYFVLDRPELKNHPGIKQKFQEVCEFFLELFRTV